MGGTAPEMGGTHQITNFLGLSPGLSGDWCKWLYILGARSFCERCSPHLAFLFVPIQGVHGVSWLVMQEVHALLFWSWKEMLSCGAKLGDLVFSFFSMLHSFRCFILFDALFDQGQPRCRPFWRNLSKLNWKGGSIFRIVLITSMLSKKHVPCGLSYKEMQSQDSMNFNPRAPRHPEAILVNSIWEGSWQKLPEIHAGSAWYASPSYQPMGTVGESAMGFTAFDWSLVYQEQNCFC